MVPPYQIQIVILIAICSLFNILQYYFFTPVFSIVRCHNTHPPRTIDKKNHRQAESTLHNLRTMLNSEAFANGCKRPEPRSKK